MKKQVKCRKDILQISLSDYTDNELIDMAKELYGCIEIEGIYDVCDFANYQNILNALKQLIFCIQMYLLKLKLSLVFLLRPKMIFRNQCNY